MVYFKEKYCFQGFRGASSFSKDWWVNFYRGGGGGGERGSRC